MNKFVLPAGKTIRDLQERYSVVHCKVRELKSPIHERFRGYECVAARPNKEQFNARTGEYQTSYRPAFCIASSYVMRDDETYRARFVEALQYWLKVREVIWED